jgi:hypothetical protein
MIPRLDDDRHGNGRIESSTAGPPWSGAPLHNRIESPQWRSMKRDRRIASAQVATSPRVSATNPSFAQPWLRGQNLCLGAQWLASVSKPENPTPTISIQIAAQATGAIAHRTREGGQGRAWS